MQTGRISLSAESSASLHCEGAFAHVEQRQSFFKTELERDACALHSELERLPATKRPSIDDLLGEVVGRNLDLHVPPADNRKLAKIASAVIRGQYVSSTLPCLLAQERSFNKADFYRLIKCILATEGAERAVLAKQLQCSDFAKSEQARRCIQNLGLLAPVTKQRTHFDVHVSKPPTTSRKNSYSISFFSLNPAFITCATIIRWQELANAAFFAYFQRKGISPML